jgi:uncharacterized protein (TIGR02231 family)
VAQRQHQLAREQQALEEQLKPLQADAQRTGGAQGLASTVLVTLSALQGGTLQLSYQVRGTGWQPGYRASLDVERQRVRLERTAQVSQNSGEDWRDVPLTLSTGQPNATASGPLPRLGASAKPSLRRRPRPCPLRSPRPWPAWHLRQKCPVWPPRRNRPVLTPASSKAATPPSSCCRSASTSPPTASS